MLLQIQLPERNETLATHRQRWAEVLNDPQWHEHPYRIETNSFGQIIMTPPAGGPHCIKQAEIAFQLRSLMGGKSLAECPIITEDGVKAADAAWYSAERFAQVAEQAAFEIAPEICVEVLSPRNTESEMQMKRQLYFAAGAMECWTCDLDGRMVYYGYQQPQAPMKRSLLCPEFPAVIRD
ncbi:MAG: Uma2 family endonuclease [Planctomycetaceae bacterium]